MKFKNNSVKAKKVFAPKKDKKKVKLKNLYSIDQFFRDAKIVWGTKPEHRKIFLEETYKVYKKWILYKTERWWYEYFIKNIMNELDLKSKIISELRQEADKNKIFDEKYYEKKQNEADVIYWECAFVIDVLLFGEKMNANDVITK